MKDFRGREIQVGQMLVYPVRRGSSMWLSEISVTDLGDGTISGINNKGRRITLSRPNRSVIVDGKRNY
jgi:hypothetical protein